MISEAELIWMQHLAPISLLDSVRERLHSFTHRQMAREERRKSRLERRRLLQTRIRDIKREIRGESFPPGRQI
jgi:hypothetical protein